MLDISKPGQSGGFVRSIMPDGHLHLQRVTTVAKALRNEHSRLFANQESGAISVAADVIRADRQVSTLKALDAMDVEAWIKDTMLDNGVALFGCHVAGAETYDCWCEREALRLELTVPGGLNMNV